MLIPLHVKSHYSLGHGTTSLERIVERAAVLGLPALGLTDIENLYGQVLFHRLAREKGLRPLTGVELQARAPSSPSHPENRSLSRPSRIVLLAQNQTGYQNLCRIITQRKLGKALDQLSNAFEHPSSQHPGSQHHRSQHHSSERCSLDPVDSIRSHVEGLFVLTDDPCALERILALPGIDRDRTGLLLVRPGRSLTAERKAAEASLRLKVPLVADPDIVLLDPPDRPFHELQVAIGANKLISQVAEEGLVEREGRHFPGPRECQVLFGDVPDAVEETHRIAGRCEIDLRATRPIFPRIPLPPGETAYSHLAKLAFQGLERRVPRITSRHVERLARELRVIEELGFCEYFIVVGDILRFARERGIEVVGRGSGAGSLVAHVLGVTNVDPIEHRLYFERFLHPGRGDLPDIDIDLCWIRRDEVIDYVYRTYGHDRVAMISSHVTFQPHLAFREAIKAFGVPMDQVNRYSRRIPYLHPEVQSKAPLRDLILSSPLSSSIPLDEEPFRTAVPLAERLLNQPHHLSVHPGGIVIGDKRIDAYVPLERAAKGIVVTQYDMYSIEDVGLVKIDLLGNRCLTELQETIGHAQADGISVRLDEIPDRDPRTIEVLESARTLGCFQLESPAMRALLSKIKAKDIRDCIAAVAIIRPGAAAGGAKEAYIRRRSGEEPPEYLHPSLRKHLESSHGVVIYEEDVMVIASAIAGISLADGDKLRSSIKKCRHPDDARDIENDFLRRSVQNGIEPDVALMVWQELRKFASYCFSKAHAAGYGVLAYQSAYLKTHFPAEFGCALLNNHAGMYSPRTIAEEIKRMGVRLLLPSINRSEVKFTLERGLSCSGDSSSTKAVRVGLGRVKSLSSSSLDTILSARSAGGPFRSLGDFLSRAPIPGREVEALILSGAFDDLSPPPGAPQGLNHPQLLWELESSGRRLSSGEAGGGSSSSCERNGHGWLNLEGGGAVYPPLKPFDLMTRIQNELKILEMAISDHPVRLLRDEARARGCIATSEAAGQVGRQVRVAGLAAATRKVRTKKGEMMQFLTLEDEKGLLESTLFPDAYQAFGARLRALGPYLVEGSIEEDHGAINLNVSKVKRWELNPHRSFFSKNSV